MLCLPLPEWPTRATRGRPAPRSAGPRRGKVVRGDVTAQYRLRLGSAKPASDLGGVVRPLGAGSWVLDCTGLCSAGRAQRVSSMPIPRTGLDGQLYSAPKPTFVPAGRPVGSAGGSFRKGRTPHRFLARCLGARRHDQKLGQPESCRDVSVARHAVMPRRTICRSRKPWACRSFAAVRDRRSVWQTSARGRSLGSSCRR
jgi:hypothetical protein